MFINRQCNMKPSFSVYQSSGLAKKALIDGMISGDLFRTNFRRACCEYFSPSAKLSNTPAALFSFVTLNGSAYQYIYVYPYYQSPIAQKQQSIFLNLQIIRMWISGSKQIIETSEAFLYLKRPVWTTTKRWLPAMAWHIIKSGTKLKKSSRLLLPEISRY